MIRPEEVVKIPEESVADNLSVFGYYPPSKTPVVVFWGRLERLDSILTAAEKNGEDPPISSVQIEKIWKVLAKYSIF